MQSIYIHFNATNFIKLIFCLTRGLANGCRCWQCSQLSDFSDPSINCFVCFFFFFKWIATIDQSLGFAQTRPSDETLNRGSDSLWSLTIPGCPLKKSRGVTPASWPYFPVGRWPSWPSNHPHTLIGFITVSSPPVAGVWWAFWHNMAAVVSSKWILHIGGGWGDIPLTM